MARPYAIPHAAAACRSRRIEKFVFLAVQDLRSRQRRRRASTLRPRRRARLDHRPPRRRPDDPGGTSAALLAARRAELRAVDGAGYVLVASRLVLRGSALRRR